jgi:LysR family nod box-dependent transcriptional activator
MNLGGLDLNLLVAPDAPLSERSVTRAAQRVGLSQSGMSNALGRLRRLLDDPLLVCQGATLVPTARAAAQIGPVHEALELIRRALDSRCTSIPRPTAVRSA